MALFCRRGNLLLIIAVLQLLVLSRTMMVPKRLMAPLSSIRVSRGTALQQSSRDRIDSLVASKLIIYLTTYLCQRDIFRLQLMTVLPQRAVKVSLN